MTRPIISETLYSDNNFHFNPVVYPKDEYIQYYENRVLSKFNLKTDQNDKLIFKWSK